MSFDLAFVDSVATSPTTRLDLNTSGSGFKTLLDGTSFGMPTLRRAVVGTLLADGERVPASAYGNRVLTLQLDLSHLDPDAAAALVQTLAKELDRPSNFLRYKANTTEAVTFLTYRSPIASNAWDMTDKAFSVPILAQPFALGVEETKSPITVTNDPAAVSNGCYFDVTSVKGDVETPARLLVEDLGLSLVLGTRRHGTPSSGKYFFQAEAMTANVDTSVPGTDAIMSGSSNNYMRTTFATDITLNVRMHMADFPAATGVDLRGTYRMLAVLRGASTGVFQIQWTLGPGGGSSVSVEGDPVTFAPLSSTPRSLIDLGRITFPVGADPVTVGYSSTERVVTGGYLEVKAARISGSGNLDWDYFVLVPDDPTRGDHFMALSAVASSATSDILIDGPENMIYPQTSGATSVPVWYPIGWVGRLPMLSPDQTNRFIALRPNKAGTDATLGDVKTSTFTVTASYYPRYMLVRPVGS